ncbi:MAG: FAD-dependent oxidoreductase, partial [Candidatus Binatia bacterium]
MSLKRKDLTSSDPLHLQTDVLILGGGPAGAWAALSAVQSGAQVILADKGYLGTSGATAPSNTGTWIVPPGDNQAQIIERRWQRTGNLADQRWMLRTVDQAYENLLKLAEWGYPFPDGEDGRLYIANLRGPDYMAFMRRRVLRAGVT